MNESTTSLGALFLALTSAITLAACAGTPVTESCEYTSFKEYQGFDIATLRYVVAADDRFADAEPFLAFQGRNKAGDATSLAVRFDELDVQLRREGCPAGSVIRTYRVTNRVAAWRLFWLTADDVTASFGVFQPDADGRSPGTSGTFGMLLFDEATGNAQVACGCLQ